MYSNYAVNGGELAPFERNMDIVEHGVIELTYDDSISSGSVETYLNGERIHSGTYILTQDSTLMLIGDGPS